MKHNGIPSGSLLEYLDDQVEPSKAESIKQHLQECASCTQEINNLREINRQVSVGLELLPQWSGDGERTWERIIEKREDLLATQHSGWRLGRLGLLTGGALATVAVVLAVTVPPVRAWAENLLAIFRVEHFTVLELNPPAVANLHNNELLNDSVRQFLAKEVIVTEPAQKPMPVTDASAATKLTNFPVKLLADRAPNALLVQGGVGMQMKIDRDRLQSILNEAGRGDLQIPSSADGAMVSLRIPTGISAIYGDCAKSMPGTENLPQGNGSCIELRELPSPIATAPQGVDPAQLAQVALQFLGMSANDAASFTQTVDWTSTLVLPVFRGLMNYERLSINGNEGVVLRPEEPARANHFMLVWVEHGIVYILNGLGDNSEAQSLAEQLK